MTPPQDFTNEELDALLDEMPAQSVAFLRASTARMVLALSLGHPILCIFATGEKGEAELYSKGLDTEDLHEVLTSTAEILRTKQANAPSSTTFQ